MDDTPFPGNRSEAEKCIALEEAMRGLAGGIDQILSEAFGKMGFALLVFEFGKPGAGQYISNAKRADTIKALRETADRLERNQDLPAGARGNTTIQ